MKRHPRYGNPFGRPRTVGGVTLWQYSTGPLALAWLSEDFSIELRPVIARRRLTANWSATANGLRVGERFRKFETAAAAAIKAVERPA